MEKTKQKKIGRLQAAVLTRTVIPIMFMGIIIALYTSRRYEKTLYEQMKPMLNTVADSVIAVYDELYEGDYILKGEESVSLYKGEQELTGDYEILDRMQQKADVEITLFYKDARILTTLKDSENLRYVATGVNGAIYHAMEERKDVLFYTVEIDGIDYYACYVPVFHSDGTLVGMVAAAKQTEQLQAAVYKALEPIWLITFICMLAAGFISVRYTQGLVDGIHCIRVFLQRMTQGELSYSMKSDILERKDEIGDTGRSVVAMQNAVRILVERDPLTTLYNRRYGVAKLKKIKHRSEISGVPFSVSLGDIDFFKQVNDTYGHEAGDLVLVQVSKNLRQSILGRGFISRWGGEEFLIVMDQCDKKHALEKLTQILQNIRNMTINYQGHAIEITMTFGLVDGDSSENFEELVRMADTRLYYGKTHGRNRIVTDMDEDDSPVREDEINGEQKETDGQETDGQDTIIAAEHRLSEEEKAAREQLKQNQMVEEIVRRMAEHLIREEAETEIVPEQKREALISSPEEKEEDIPATASDQACETEEE